jgi:gamma-glutamylcysteine synthetase
MSQVCRVAGRPFANSNEPIVICVVGSKSVQFELENIVAGKKVGERAFAVRRLVDTQQASPCQILFIGAREWKRNQTLPNPLKGAATLTDGETEDFMALGGIIDFKLEGSRVRIQVNFDIASAAALSLTRSFSARLRS